VVCLSTDCRAWRPVSRQSLSGLDWLNDDIGSLRAAYETACRVMPGGARWQAIACGDRWLGLLMHPPARADGPRQIIVYFHGGGWIVGSPLTHADISGALSTSTGLEVVSVAYRLAPEFPAPAPIEDGLAAIEHVLARDGETTLILCGDSAGAAIALAVANAASDAIKARLAGIAACYGSYGLLDSASLREYGTRESGLDKACLARMWRCAHGDDAASPYSIDAVSRAPGAPVYILVGALDAVFDDSIALAEALDSGGRAACLDIASGQGHGFLHGGLEAFPARSAFARLAQWIGTLPLI
jgi:acetyl esterase/lipase